MTRRRSVLVLVVALVVAAAAAAAAAVVVVVTRETGGGGGAPKAGVARVFGTLPAGYRYGRMDPDDLTATIQLYREEHGATDVAATVVATPQGTGPVGVTVVAFVLASPPDPPGLAHGLERDVPLATPRPKTLAGQPVLSHEDDATFSAADLWVHGRLAVVAYGATTAEVDGVMAGLLADGAWRGSPAA